MNPVIAADRLNSDACRSVTGLRQSPVTYIRKNNMIRKLIEIKDVNGSEWIVDFNAFLAAKKLNEEDGYSLECYKLTFLTALEILVLPEVKNRFFEAMKQSVKEEILDTIKACI